jgi:hypothetical protein
LISPRKKLHLLSLKRIHPFCKAQIFYGTLPFADIELPRRELISGRDPWGLKEMPISDHLLLFGILIASLQIKMQDFLSQYPWLFGIPNFEAVSGLTPTLTLKE